MQRHGTRERARPNLLSPLRNRNQSRQFPVSTVLSRSVLHLNIHSFNLNFQGDGFLMSGYFSGSWMCVFKERPQQILLGNLVNLRVSLALLSLLEKRKVSRPAQSSKRGLRKIAHFFKYDILCPSTQWRFLPTGQQMQFLVQVSFRRRGVGLSLSAQISKGAWITSAITLLWPLLPTHCRLVIPLSR
jgi:hypothetical protein